MLTPIQNLNFDPLKDFIRQYPEKSLFPERLINGKARLDSVRYLSSRLEAFKIDYSDMTSTSYPETVSLQIESPGIVDGILWVQELWYNNLLLFSNESVSWMAVSRAAEPGQSLTVSLDKNWLERNCH